MTKLPLYEDTPRLSRFIDGLVSEMKRGSFLYSEHDYAMAKDVFMDEQLDVDPEKPSSKGMLAVMFYSTLQALREDNAQEMCDDPPRIIMIGDVRRNYTMPAPRNDQGFVSILCDGHTNEMLTPLTSDEATAFHAHVRHLNAILSRRM